MEIPASTNVATATNRTDPGTPGGISSDFDTFLRMMTAQIQNQDPLNPMEPDQFAVQLATFSGVEQQVRTNDLLLSLVGQMGESGFGQMASWVGMEARAPMPVQLTGEPLTITPPSPVAGERHDIVAFDSRGQEVWREGIDPDAGSVTWYGRDPVNGDLPTGLYEFRLESFEEDRLVASEAAQTYGPVQEVRVDPRGMLLYFAGGVQVLADTVTALRNPNSSR